MKPKDKQPPQPPLPVDVQGGIADRSSKRSPWKYALLAAIFLAWLAFLIYVRLAG